MAIKDEIREQRKKLKGQGFKAHISWFVTYYGAAAIAVITCIAVAVYFIFRIVTGKEQALGIVMINAGSFDLFSDEDAGTEIAEAFSEYAGIDTKKYNIYADLNEHLDISEDMDYSTVERIFALSASNQLDVMTADPEVYAYYSDAQTFEDLRDHFSEEELSEFEKIGLLYYGDSKDEEGNVIESHVPVGIICTDSNELKRAGAFKDSECITGIIGGCPHPETAREFIRFLIK